jgi:hypothetical protein
VSCLYCKAEEEEDEEDEEAVECIGKGGTKLAIQQHSKGRE